MSFGLIIVEDRAALRAVIAPSTRNLLRAALPLAVGAGVAMHFMLALPWPRALLLGAAVGLGATLVAAFADFLGPQFPQTWWFRPDSIHIQRGPFDRRIPWEAILRWQLVPAPGTPGAHFLTIWHGYDDDRVRASTILTPRDTAPDTVARALQGYQRAV